jgi:hypothetical protein
MFVFADFVADDAAHGGTVVLRFLRRHPGTTTQAEQHGCGNDTEYEYLHGIDDPELVHNRSLM